jgi:hypothetical protein
MKLLPLLLLALTVPGAVFPSLHAADSTTEADVIVYGATPGGFCAAIGAAREGAKVILLEPTAHVGGVNTGGLSFSDSNQTVRSTLKGLFEEWHLRVEKDYKDRGIALKYDVMVKDQSVWTYEPSVAARVTHQMLKEAGVQVLTRRQLAKVNKDGATIREITTSDGTFKGKTYIDATYEGDLMAAAGVAWTIGREGRKAYGESLAGKQYPKAKMPISGLNDQGKALPLITTTDAGPEEEGDGNVMVYSFRLCLTGNPANRVPFPEPANYDPARFEVVRRYFQNVKNPPILWDLYPLPGEKFDANNGIGKQFSMGLVGACNGWSEAGPGEREKIWEAHKQYTLELYKFLTTDPSVPEAQRRQLAELGLCKDEFADYGHWSPQLYVREGRRMKGIYFLTQADIQEKPAKDDAIAVSSFPIDSHDCQRVALPEGGVINEGTIFPVRLEGRRHGPAFHIPYRSILPQKVECTNLLVPVALSCTHVAISSIRVEPTWMTIGHSAGVAAALVSRSKAPAQDLPYAQLRERLLAQGQVLELPVLPPLPPAPVNPVNIDLATLPGVVLDDSQAELTGNWDRSSSFKPHVGRGYLHDNRRGDGQSTAIFRVKLPKSGRYELRMAYSPHATRATKVPVIIKSGGAETRLTVDETQPLDQGGAFRSVGQVDLTGDGTQETTITISNAQTEGFVILDAIQLLEASKK